MIELKDVPKTALLIVTIHFKGWKTNYVNDSRRFLNDTLPNLCKKNNLSLELMPITYSTVKTFTLSFDRSIGVAYEYGMINCNPEDFLKLYNSLNQKKKPYWNNISLMIAENIEGLE